MSAGHVLPPALIHGCDVENTLVGEGSVLKVCCPGAQGAPSQGLGPPAAPDGCHAAGARRHVLQPKDAHTGMLVVMPVMPVPAAAARAGSPALGAGAGCACAGGGGARRHRMLRSPTALSAYG